MRNIFSIVSFLSRSKCLFFNFLPHVTFTENLQWKIVNFVTPIDSYQGVWNRREIPLTRPALPYDYTCFADGYSICIRNIQNRLLYTCIIQMFLIQMEYCLQSMYQYMVGWAASIISPFYSLLPGHRTAN